MDQRKLEKVHKILSLMRDDTVTPKEIEQFLHLVLGVIKEANNELKNISNKTLSEIAEGLDIIKKNHSDTISEIDQKATKVTADFNNKLLEINLFLKEVKKMRLKGDAGKDGKDGINPKPEDVVPLVLEKIPKSVEETGETIADKLESLKGDKRLDASAIKNLPEATGGKGGSTARNLWQLQDVVLTEVADNEILKYDSDLQAWVNGTGGSGGVDTANSPNANEFARFTDADTIEGRTIAEVYSDLGITASAVELNLLDGITTLSGSNTGDQTSIVGITGTKAQFDTAVTDGNFLYVGDVTSNATHTGEVTGATALTVDKTAITNKSEVNAAVGDHVLIADASDSSNLKKVTVQTIVDLASGSGVPESLAIAYAVSL